MAKITCVMYYMADQYAAGYIQAHVLQTEYEILTPSNLCGRWWQALPVGQDGYMYMLCVLLSR